MTENQINVKPSILLCPMCKEDSSRVIATAEKFSVSYRVSTKYVYIYAFEISPIGKIKEVK